MLQSNVLTARKINQVMVDEDKFAADNWIQIRDAPVRKLTQVRTGEPLAKDLQMIMHPSTKPSPTPLALWQSACATAWVFHYWSTGLDVPIASWRTKALMHGTIVRCKLGNSRFVVIATEMYSFKAWPLDEESDGTLSMRAVANAGCRPLIWQHVVDVTDWEEFPFSVALPTLRPTSARRVVPTWQ